MDQDRNPNAETNSQHQDQGTNPAFSQVPPAPGFQPPYAGAEPPKKHSGLGIAAFILSLISIACFIIAIVLVVAFSTQLYAGNEDLYNELLEWTDSYSAGTGAEPDFAGSEALGGMVASVLGAVILLFGSVALAFIGLILGLIGAFAKTRKRVFAIIGTVLNGLIVVGSIGFLIISLTAAASV